MTVTPRARTTTAALALAAGGCLMALGASSRRPATALTAARSQRRYDQRSGPPLSAPIPPTTMSARSTWARNSRRHRRARLQSRSEQTQQSREHGRGSVPARSAIRRRLRCPVPGRRLRRQVRGRAAAPADRDRPPAIYLRRLRREQHRSRREESAAAGPGRLRRLANGGRLQQQQRQGHRPGRDPAEPRCRLQAHRHRAHSRVLRADSKQQQRKFSRFEFGGGDANDQFNDELDAEPQTLFFEGDFGSLYSGFSGQEASFDLPFTVGLFPLFLQNGIWANDAIIGGAVSLPAKNSAALGLANFDITFFAAFDDVDNAGIIGPNEDNAANLYGVTAFIDAFSGYIETGYGLIRGPR